MSKLIIVLSLTSLFLGGCIELPNCDNALYHVHGICVNPPAELNRAVIQAVIEGVHAYEGIGMGVAKFKYRKAEISINWDADSLPDDADGLFVWTNDPRGKKGAIFLRQDDSDSYEISTLIHELLHLAWWMDHGDADDEHRYLGVNLLDACRRQTEDYQVYQSLVKQLNLEPLCD